MYDVVIVGGGPAGLNAALFLGRCRRTVLLVDAGRPRNARSRWVSGFLTRDGTDPWELREAGRRDLIAYPSVTVVEAEVSSARQGPDGFRLRLAGWEEVVDARKVILATGLGCDLPDIPDGPAFYGRGVYPCPYCDGWEHRDQPLAAYGRGKAGRGLVLELTVWSDDVVLLTHGPSDLSGADRHLLDQRGIPVIETPLAGLDGDPDAAGLTGIRLADGTALARPGLFFTFDECRQSPLVAELGCDLTETGAVATGSCERTNVPGLYVAGDASKRVKFAVVAAAEGAMAAFAVNTDLLRDGIKADSRRAA